MTKKTATLFSIMLAAIVVAAYGGVRYSRVGRRVAPLIESAQLGHFDRLAKVEPTASNFRALAQKYLAHAMYQNASDAWGNAANVYRRRGDPNAAYANQAKSDRYSTEVVPFFHRRAKIENVEKYYSSAKLEPIYGCYIGAFIDHEDSVLGTYRDEYGHWRRDVTAFNHLVGSKHAIFFMYLGYGRKFPKKFVTHMNDNGAAAQIAWEPKDLREVKDNSYLRGFARQACQSKTPIFIRFASEMNGDWTLYHGDPELYREKFRLVAKVMHEEAPNVAMVWCPFEIPQRLIEDYYPGPDAVDWAGINIYSVLFYNNKVDRPADWRNPADQLRYVYDTYSNRHPIMICEYAASHMSSLDMQPRAEFARDKIGQLYAALPRLYPRIKAVCWLSMNAVKHAMPGRQKNNYAILDDNWVRKRYEQMLYTPYYLNAVSRSAPAMSGEEILPLGENQVLKGKIGLSAWVKTYEDRPSVVWRVNGVERVRTDRPGPYKWTLDTRSLPDGPGTVELEVTDTRGVIVRRERRQVMFENSSL